MWAHKPSWLPPPRRPEQFRLRYVQMCPVSDSNKSRAHTLIHSLGGGPGAIIFPVRRKPQTIFVQIYISNMRPGGREWRRGVLCRWIRCPRTMLLNFQTKLCHSSPVSPSSFNQNSQKTADWQSLTRADEEKEQERVPIGTGYRYRTPLLPVVAAVAKRAVGWLVGWLGWRRYEWCHRLCCLFASGWFPIFVDHVRPFLCVSRNRWWRWITGLLFLSNFKWV